MIRILARLQFRQFFGQKNKGLAGWVFVLLYFWLLEILAFILLKKEGVTTFPPLLVAGICLSAIFPDFLFKVIFLRDQTVMDAFLKSRPIPQGSWDRFLTLSQCWRISNLVMPLILLPACFLFLSFGKGLLLFLALYLFSVFGGFLVMLLKHRGPYASEKSAAVKAHTVKSGTGNLVFGLQSKSFLRSKRLKTMAIYLFIFFFLEYFLQAWGDESGRLALFYLFGFIFLPGTMLTQYGLGIEAGFFCGIWSRPLAIRRLLTDKFRMSAILCGLAALICLPVCLIFHQSVTTPLAYALFSTGCGGVLMQVDAYNCIPFDLFGKTFFNYQGAKGTYKASVMVGIMLIMALGIGLPLLLPGWKSELILATLGTAAIAIHRPFFRWVERKFLKDKYKYMEKYLSK